MERLLGKGEMVPNQGDSFLTLARAVSSLSEGFAEGVPEVVFFQKQAVVDFRLGRASLVAGGPFTSLHFR